MNRTRRRNEPAGRSMTSVPVEEQFRCCICLDIYTQPVSIPCGHNFCLDCIKDYWDTKSKPECPLCKEVFPKRPKLRINTTFADMIQLLQRSLSPMATQEDDGVAAVSPESGTGSVVPCDVCRDSKAASVKSCLVCQASYCDAHLAPHLRDAELKRHRLTDPATFPSSHLCRNHNRPLTRFCTNDRKPVCDKCVQRDHKQHRTVTMETESSKIKTSMRETNAQIQKMIQTRLGKMEQIKASVDQSRKTTQREVERSSQVCSLLVASIEGHQAKLVEELEQRQEESERRAEELLDELTLEINALQTRHSELQHLELTQNPLHVLQSFPSLSAVPATREWSEVAVHPDNCMGALRNTMDKFLHVCQEVVNRVCAEEVEKLQQFAVDVTLDPESASGWLLLSTEGKKVSCQKNRTPVPSSPQRFESVCVLGKQNFASGRHYWVVQVGDKSDWDLGVARGSVNRKGSVVVRPDRGFWAICRRKGGLSACSGPSVSLHPQGGTQRVGIFLDYDAGSVSFYDADAKTHIYTYSGCGFTEPLRPYFNPCPHDNGRNVAPLVICPVGA